MSVLSIEIHDDLSKISTEWESLIPKDYVYLSIDYLSVLREVPPKDYILKFVAFRLGDELVGAGILQYVMFRTAEKLRYNFGPQWLKNILNAVLVCFGNLTVTGDKQYYLAPHLSDSQKVDAIQQLITKSFQLRTHNDKRPQLFLWKELSENHPDFRWISASFPTLKQHRVQPSMIFDRDPGWKEFQDYILALKSNYRMAFRRYKSKGRMLRFHELSHEEIQQYENEIYAMYQNTAHQAGFNSFSLHPQYFSKMKESMVEDFKCVSIWLEEKIVGFYTLMCKDDSLHAHFIGMTTDLRANVYLYNNMLFKMVAQLFEVEAHSLYFGRTALESKSAIGAKPKDLILLSQHVRPLLNTISGCVFRWLYPGEVWRQRHPFRRGELSSPVQQHQISPLGEHPE